MIGSDFIRLETEMRAQEEQDAREYSEFLNDTDLDKTAKNKDLEQKNQLKQDQEQALTEKKADLAGTQKELNSVMASYNKLIFPRSQVFCNPRRGRSSEQVSLGRLTQTSFAAMEVLGSLSLSLSLSLSHAQSKAFMENKKGVKWIQSTRRRWGRKTTRPTGWRRRGTRGSSTRSRRSPSGGRTHLLQQRRTVGQRPDETN